jgi:hypothetical protein
MKLHTNILIAAGPVFVLSFRPAFIGTSPPSRLQATQLGTQVCHTSPEASFH